MEITLIYAASSFYEILLIVLVLIFIFNGLLRRQILKKVNDKLNQDHYGNATFKKNKPLKKKDIEDEYVDYEIIKD